MKANDLTEEQVASLYTIIRPIASKFRFGYHDIDDMVQQGFIELLEAIESGDYDSSRPLESFAKSHVHHRLFNFKRNNFCRPEPPCLCCDSDSPAPCVKYRKWHKRNSLKMGLTQGVSDGIEYQIQETVAVEEILVSAELSQQIDGKLPVSIRSDYLRMKDGVPIPKKRREKVKQAIKELLDGNV